VCRLPDPLQRPSGTGKFTIAIHVAAQLGRPVALIHGDDEYGSSDLDHHGHAYLIDFEIACPTESGELSVETGCTLTGTPAYLAPELAGERAIALPSSGRYSLGVVFYELLCGRTPFTSVDRSDHPPSTGGDLS
jgi:serine/threonine protein kinase